MFVLVLQAKELLEAGRWLFEDGFGGVQEMVEILGGVLSGVQFISGELVGLLHGFSELGVFAGWLHGLEQLVLLDDVVFLADLTPLSPPLLLLFPLLQTADVDQVLQVLLLTPTLTLDPDVATPALLPPGLLLPAGFQQNVLVLGDAESLGGGLLLQNTLLEVLHLVAHRQSLGGLAYVSDELEGALPLLLADLLVQHFGVFQLADLFVYLGESLVGRYLGTLVLFAVVVEGQETVGTQ